MKGVERYKLLVIKQRSHGDVIYTMLAIINNIVLHI